VDVLKEFMTAQGWYTAAGGRTDAYAEITLSNLAHLHWDDVTRALAGKIDGLMNIDFKFLGVNLGEIPQWNFFTKTDWSDPSVWGPALGLFLIPFISAALSWASIKISSAATPATGDAQSQATMKSMNLMMPLMSIWICFVMPAAMGIYWIANSVFGMTRDYILTKIYKKQLDEEDKVRAAERAEREREMEAKRAEYERLKAEGKTAANQNTSKKKLQASEKQRLDERKAALDRADRAARRERLGIKANEVPASQVGNRRYARGRAYVPDRFEHPETAEAETLAAAAASQDAPAIDESVAEDFPEAAASLETAVESFEAAEAAELADADVGAEAGESDE
jgi:YidC/Oxa1 family membrane protein insertase